MPIDASCYLPANVHVSHLRSAMARLIGFDIDVVMFNTVADQYVRIVPSPGMVYTFMFEWGPTGVKNTPWHHHGGLVTFHFESCSSEHGNQLRTDGRLLKNNSYARNIALFDQLARFFGGEVDPDDRRDEPRFKYPVRCSRDNAPTGNDDWNELMKRLNDLQAIKLRDLKPFEKFAAYESPK